MKFDILVADCPWSYNRKNTGGTNKSSSSQQYDTMTFSELQSLSRDITPLMNENSVCFLWITVPMLNDAIYLLLDWNFQYKTMITWVKRNNGLGNWFRGKTEHLLMGVKGKVKPFRLQAPNLIISDKTLKHSEKPLESYILVQQCAQSMIDRQNYEKVDVLELFARSEISFPRYQENIKWTCIGKEITGNDIKTDLQNILEYIPRVDTEI